MPLMTLLVGPEHANWVGLETIITRHLPSLRVLDAVLHATQAIEIAKREHPDIVLVESGTDSQSTSALVTSLHIASPTSKIVMIGECPNAEDLSAMTQGGIVGFLEWDYLCAGTLRLFVDAVNAGLTVFSLGIMSALNVPDRRRPRHCGIVLTNEQRVVLKRLLEGLSQEEIAQFENMSIAKVRRVVAQLRDIFAAPSNVALGAKAARYGFAG